jgi:hypothetical protein
MKRIIVLLLGTTHFVLAHHGQDFLLNYDTDVPEIKRAVAFSAFEWSREGDTDEISFEPGFLVGVVPGFALGTTVRVADEGSGSWDYSGVNPMIQYQFPTRGDRWSFGIFAGYLFADGETHHHSETTVHIHDPNPGGIDLGPDAPPAGPVTHIHEESESDEHSHTGIHRHDEDHFQLRLLFQARLWKDSKWVGNLICVTPGGGDYAFGYSTGLRQQLSHEWAVGVESIGDFNTQGDHEVLAGVYWTPVHSCTVRLGAGTGIGSESKDFAIHSGITWRF